MFLVATTIDEATEYRDLLIGSDMLGSAEQVLLVTSEEPDATLALLDRPRTRTRQCGRWCRCRCSGEGWDVKNIYVIASVRSMESNLLTEQILGRGLRLLFGQRTGNPMLDTVEVLAPILPRHCSSRPSRCSSKPLVTGWMRRPSSSILVSANT